jgi:hypothetical protein
MFRPPISNPALKRTIRPIYAQHQATTYGGFLDPNWNRSFDILPGTVMTRVSKEIFAPWSTGKVPFGLSALFVAPSLGVDEVTATGTNLFTVWVGGPQAVFEILAPAFDPAPASSWATEAAKAGGTALLKANATGQLTTGGVAADAIAELVDVPTVDKILIRMRYPA